MPIFRGLALLSLFVGLGLAFAGTIAVEEGPALFFAGVAVVFTVVLLGLVVLLLRNARPDTGKAAAMAELNYRNRRGRP